MSGLYAKISHPVLTNLKLTAGEGVTLSEVYPNELPDLFHGGQLVVLGRYHGKGHAAADADRQGRQGEAGVRLRGRTSRRRRTTTRASSRTCGRGARSAICWTRSAATARRRSWWTRWSTLAKKHGIATPYTSYLVVPDTAPTANLNRTPPVSGTNPTPGGFQPGFTVGLNSAEDEGDVYRNHGYNPQTPSALAAPAVSAGTGTSATRPPGSSSLSPYLNLLRGGDPGVGPGQINYAPTFISPTMQWSAPATAAAPAVPPVEGNQVLAALRRAGWRNCRPASSVSISPCSCRPCGNRIDCRKRRRARPPDAPAWRSAACGSTRASTPRWPTSSSSAGAGVLPHPGAPPRDQGSLPARQPRDLDHAEPDGPDDRRRQRQGRHDGRRDRSVVRSEEVNLSRNPASGGRQPPVFPRNRGLTPPARHFRNRFSRHARPFIHFPLSFCPE